MITTQFHTWALRLTADQIARGGTMVAVGGRCVSPRDRAVRLPASGNCSTRASSSRIRPLAAMSNGVRAGKLVQTDSTHHKTRFDERPTLAQQSVDLAGLRRQRRIPRGGCRG